MKNKIIVGIISLFSVFTSISSANPTLGPIYDRDFLKSGNVVNYDFMINSDEMTIIKVFSYMKGDIDCYLYDSSYSLVGLNEQIGNVPCTFVINPSYTNAYQLSIVNNGVYTSMFEINVW